MLKVTIATVAALAIAFVIHLVTYLGVFRPVEIETGVRPATGLLYKDHLGPYHKINSVISDIETWAKANGIECKLTFGEYFDDPSAVEEVRLRSRGGCLVSTKPAQFPDDFKYEDSPEAKAVVAKFSGSAAIGPYRVYGKVTDYMSEGRMISNGPTREVYEIISDKAMNTTYYFPF